MESRAIFEGSKPTNAIRLQSHNANLSNPVNFGRWAAEPQLFLRPNRQNFNVYYRRNMVGTHFSEKGVSMKRLSIMLVCLLVVGLLFAFQPGHSWAQGPDVLWQDVGNARPIQSLTTCNPLLSDDHETTPTTWTETYSATQTENHWQLKTDGDGYGGSNNYWFVADIDSRSTSYLTSPTVTATHSILDNWLFLRFYHAYSMENTYDGGALEINIDGGGWTYIAGSQFTQNGYNNTIASDASGSSLINMDAFTGDSGGDYIESIVDLKSLVNPGQSFQIHFWQANDNGSSEVGWYVDDVLICQNAPVSIYLPIIMASFTPPTPTPNLFQYNGYWLSPIEDGTGAYIQTYGNICPEYLNETDLSCIQNWKGEKGKWPEDYWEILVCPHHIVEWDIAWDHWGEKVFAVQGGQVTEVTLEDNNKTGVHFFIVDKKSDNWYGANYGHVNVYSMADNGIITQEQLDRVLAGEMVDGEVVYEGQLLGITGDDCCSNGVLHIGPVYGGFWGTNAAGDFYYTEPSELWELGEWPDVADSRPPEAGNPCPSPYQ